ncbi:cell growth-regulating nucleolar protein [Microplitis mediator]|uniref:cell growth-regulating nucleolar protein n=1 Tax=Microplitis mediator TaxID=375433 RepID=UPI002557B5CF|nr:cell growth-regulating nucleolar protein [Microplitis mediator]
MVVFTCNNCGDSLQKPRVAKHYQFQCRKRVSLSCVDCFKDFLDDDYVSHTKCITEAERYGGKNFVAKPSANKGERKQQEWIKIINSVLCSSNLSKEEKNFLKNISKHENVPRKKPKFLNFVKNAMGYRVDVTIAESCFDKIESAFKEVNNKQINGVKNDESANDKSSGEVKQESKDETNGLISNGQEKKAKKNKRKLENEHKEEEEEEVEEKKLKVENSEQEVSGKLIWKEKIIEIIGERNEISLKKLRKKMIKFLPEYENEEEKFNKKLTKKLSKIEELVLEDNKIKRK